jgi:putative ATP-binding cassette transporter
MLAVLGQRRILDLRTQLSRSILAAPLRRLEELGPSRLLATLTSDVASIVIAVGSLPLLFVQCTVILGGLAYLGWLSWKALAVVVVVLTAGTLLYRTLMIAGSRYQRQARELSDRMYDHFRSATMGVKELQLHARREDALLVEMESTGLQARRLSVKTTVLFSTASGFGQLVVFAAVGIVLFGLPALTEVDPRALTGYALLLLFLMTPLEIVLDSIPTLSSAMVAFRKVDALGLSLEGHRPAGAPRELPRHADEPWRTLELAGVTHAYHREGEEGSFTLGPVDLEIRSGEVLFMVGGNGSGKTTLAKLITGLYAPEGGEVRWDGRPVTDADRREHLQRFSVVFADFFLFDSLLGLEGDDLDERAARHLRQLQLDHKVRVENGRLSTTGLSQGQRKRLALLTAYLEDRPVYLFDEWAADQDPTFKELFYRTLVPDLRARGKTVVVISHDDHYYHTADRVVKLDYGRVEYDGPPEGLFSRAATPLEATL